MSLQLHYGASLAGLNTLRVPAWAGLLAQPDAIQQLPDLFAAARAQGLPWLIIGEGSNLLLVGDFEGLVVQPRLHGIRLAISGVADGARAVRDDRVRVRAGAGENWHRFVQWTLDRGLCGLENLALIPGSVGAAPVQNIGAYGVELRDHLAGVDAFDCQQGGHHHFNVEDCAFGYRDSRFKREPDRWLITAVEFDLPRSAPPVLGYAGLREELAARGLDDPQPRDVFEAVCAIRRRKLPDPAQLANAGSFFKNPVVPELQAAFIADHHPDMPIWPAGEARSKLSAAWLIEQSGLKGHRLGDAGISERHALVLVNHGNASGEQLWALARHVQDTVQARFGVALEPEPRIITASGGSPTPAA